MVFSPICIDPIDFFHIETNLSIGDRVIVSSGMGSRAGILQYIGETKFAPGNWCGVQLDEPTGKNDGTVDGVQYVFLLLLIWIAELDNSLVKSQTHMCRFVCLPVSPFVSLDISIVHNIMVYLFLWQRFHCHRYRVKHVCHVPIRRNHSIQLAQWAVLHQQIHHVCV